MNISSALTARLLTDLEFPYMVLLISGGHCLLAVAKGINDFLLLGKTIDDPIGEAFDKVSPTINFLSKVKGQSGQPSIGHSNSQF